MRVHQDPSLSLICLCSQQLPETPVPAHRPPEEDGEDDEGKEEGEEEEEDDDEDEEWEDVSEDVTDEEEEEEEFEEEEGLKEQEAAAVTHDQSEVEPVGKATCEQVDPEPSRPQESLSPACVEPPSPFSPTGDHQPVSDWGEEMELNSPSTAHSPGAHSLGEAWPFGNA